MAQAIAVMRSPDPRHRRRWAAYPSTRLNALAYRWATSADAAELARLNQLLVREGADFGPDEIGFLHRRMREWLASGLYRAVLFVDADGRTLAYALFRESDEEIYLAQFLVLPHARRHGVGHAAIERLRRDIWRRGKRLTLDVLAQNRAALDFWHGMGWRDCAMTLEIPVADTPPATEAVQRTGLQSPTFANARSA